VPAVGRPGPAPQNARTKATGESGVSRQEILRAFKFALDPTPAQTEALSRHAGAARWAFNYALGMTVTAHEEGRARVGALGAQGAALVRQAGPEAGAGKKAKAPVRPSRLCRRSSTG